MPISPPAPVSRAADGPQPERDLPLQREVGDRKRHGRDPTPSPLGEGWGEGTARLRAVFPRSGKPRIPCQRTAVEGRQARPAGSASIRRPAPGQVEPAAGGKTVLPRRPPAQNRKSVA